MFTEVIVGWDGSEAAEAALRWAVDRDDGTPLKIVHAIGGVNTSSEVGRAGGELSAERVRLIDRARQLRDDHPYLTVGTSTEHGDPVEVLGGAMTAGTLLVVGGPGSPPSSRWTVGSRLAGRHGGGTVAVIPSAPATEARSGVVVGVDGSPASMTAIAVAAAQAALAGERLTVVHAWTVPPTWNAFSPEFEIDADRFEEMHGGLLSDAVDFARSLAPEVAERLEQGRPSEVLESIGRDASVVVVGSHGAGVVRRFLLGSVSHDLLVALPGPTMVVAPAATVT